jgi:hypothetical protein
MAFCFGWLVIGECSTIFLNVRWYLLKSGRGGGKRSSSRNMGRRSNYYYYEINNGLFALTFFITRMGIYSAGMVHVLYYSRKEVLSLPEVSGVPMSMLGLTCGCMILGWILNFVWGWKILSMVIGGGGGGSSSSSGEGSNGSGDRSAKEEKEKKKKKKKKKNE